MTGGTAGKQQTTGHGTAEDRLLARLGELLAGLSDPALERILTAVRQVGELDRAVYEAIATVPAPAIDGPARRLSQAAIRSQLWLAIAAALALAGGPAGRRPRRGLDRGHVGRGEPGHQAGLGQEAPGPRGRRGARPPPGPDA